jgi:hypothetical protein
MTDPTYEVSGADLAYLLRSVLPILPASEWPRLGRAVATARATIDGALTRQRGAADHDAVLESNRSDLAQIVDAILGTPPQWPVPIPWPWPGPWPWPWPWRPDDGEPDPVVAGTELPAIAVLAAGAEFHTAGTLLAGGKHEVGPATGSLAAAFTATAHSLFLAGTTRLGKHEP